MVSCMYLVFFAGMLAWIHAGHAAPVDDAAAGSCATPYAGETRTIIQGTPWLNGTAAIISGTVRIVDGCSFAVDNFTFFPGSNDTIWYGRLNGYYTIGHPISEVPVPTLATPGNLVFPLVPGSNWKTIDSLIMISQSERLQLGYVQFNFSEAITGIADNSPPQPTTGSNGTFGNVSSGTNQTGNSPAVQSPATSGAYRGAQTVAGILWGVAWIVLLSFV